MRNQAFADGAPLRLLAARAHVNGSSIMKVRHTLTSSTFVKVAEVRRSTRGAHNVSQSSCRKYRIRLRNADDSVM